jgi:hypothetical protein
MAEPRLIREYLADLDDMLPSAIVEELADGLEETYHHHLATGLETQAAARAALAEFGDPATIAVAFTNAGPARHAARTLLRAGPVVGGCWAAALINARAWDWTMSAPIPLALAMTLVAVIALLLMAAFCHRYRAARRAAATALIGTVVLDVALSSMLALPGPMRGWLLMLAAGLSLARASFAAKALRRIHAS